MQFRFAEYVLDVARRELRRGGDAVAIEPQVFDLLVHLVRNSDRVVTKDELLDAVWGGRIVSESTLTSRINAARKAVGDSGETQLLIRTSPRKGFRFVGGVTDAVPMEIPHTSYSRPSIAVLPFDNLSGDREQDYFVDGMVAEIITGLSRIKWLFVISRNSTFIYKGKPVDVKTVGRELGVRYVLEGSVRRVGRQLRISAQLIDAMTGGHHWAEQYDRELGDIFAVQDEITRSVVAAIEPRLLAAEGVRAFSRSPDDLGAWELVARAQAHVSRLTRSDNQAAIDGLKRAVEAYPDYAPARGLLGFCLVFAAHNGWIDLDQGLLTGRKHIARAVALDDCDPWGQIAFGYSSMMERHTEESIAAFRRAVNLNPNSAVAHCYLSHGLAFAGEDREAIAHGENAIRLSPLDPEMAMMLGGIAVAHYLAGRYAKAVRYSSELLRLRPGFQGAQRLRCASLAQAGRIDEARSFLATIRLEQPQLSIDWIRASVPYQTPALMERFLEGMRKAGLTEN